MWLLIFLPLLLLLYVFPTGRLLSRRWLWAPWAAGLIVLDGLIDGTLTRTVGPPFRSWSIDTPIGFLPAAAADNPLFGLALPLLTIGGLTAIVLRYRRSDLVVRTQVKWVIFSGVIFATVTIVVIAVEHPLVPVAFVMALVFVPISITIAITRHRLFEIERLVSRTVSYAMVIGLLAAVFGGVIALAAATLPTDGGVEVAGATLLVAGLFNPVRVRMQELVDQRFNRSAYQVQSVTTAFASQLQGEFDTVQVAELLVRTIDATMHPASADVWISDVAST